MSAMTFLQLRSRVPTQHQAEFDSKMAACDGGTQGTILTWIQAIEAFLAQFGATINWGCLFGLWPQILAAVSNPTLFLAVISAYFACANPPVPAP